MADRANPSGVPPKPTAKPRDPSLQALYRALKEEAALARLVIEVRTRARLTQQELADRMGVPVSAIVRLENGTASPGLSLLRRVAKATGTRLELSFVPQHATGDFRRRKPPAFMQ